MTGRPLPELPDTIRAQTSFNRSRNSILEEGIDKEYGRQSSSNNNESLANKVEFLAQGLKVLQMEVHQLKRD